ncbi:stealth conserved region 3 domain-containing protein [Microbacterium pumilum]|uniref:Stealth family protein n=1 Tax=Microbacterium pumilum TaxID=344165 RepID=A0ABP5ECV0_9MICO
MANLSALPQQEHSWSGLIDRDDIVWDRGLLHLVHDSLTPDQARVADLLLVAEALEQAGVPVLLIRHDRAVPALVADLSHGAVASAALAALGEREPLYVKARRQPPQLAAEADALPASPTALRVYRPRVVRGGGLRYGSSLAARLEFWRFGEELVEAPNDNALMRRASPVHDLAYEEVERFGRTWRTISGMFDAQPDEFTHDVDLVFSWVDGSSTDFQRQRAAHLAEYVVGEGDDGPARYRHVDELRYALRSVYMYAPWVRRIFIATDSPVPEWLREHPKITIVRSEEFFADPTVLPTHNSHAVEAQLHRIPGLAEHFIYSNDDMFFGRLVEPELFFSAAGVSQFVECEVRIGVGAPDSARSGHDNGLRVNRELLRKRFGRTILRDLEHCATPLRRSVMSELEQTFASDFARTAASRFRSATDVSVTNSLYHYYALMTGRAVTTTRPQVRYVQTTLVDSPRRMERLAGRTDIDMFCLNDGGAAQIPEEVRVRALRTTLERMFPVRPPWERDEISEARRSARSAHPSGRH